MADAFDRSKPHVNVGIMGHVDHGKTLRSMTQGRASSSMELDHYADVPPNVAQTIIAKNAR